MEEIEGKKKSHRDRNSGRKAEKKKSKKDAQNPVVELTDKQRNPKAFAFNSAIRAERRFRRKQDIETKKQHVPLVDRVAIEPPPILIAVVGPPKVGKTTVINNLIKLFTKSPMTEMKGPVTVVIGKKRRITLIECNNDINSMIDLAKVADLVLLLCDASFGFEMEIFEFLNICQVHGMPRIMGILTHLDMIKSQKTLKNTKKTLKHRFWTEVYPGAKLFYLSGIIHGEYLRNEVKNLGRFISVMKFRPLTWRTTHSYLLGDRYEDLTNQELIRKNPKCDRSISLYGYMRGVPITKNSMVHIAGFGDLKIQDISYLSDPCPLPDQIKKRALIEKEKLVYAPFSGVGGIVYDKDAVYVELGGSHSHNRRKEEDESTNLMTNLIETKETLDTKMEHSKMKIFTEGEELTANDFINSVNSIHAEDATSSKNRENTNSDKNSEDDLNLAKELEDLRKHKEELIEDSGRMRRKVVFDITDEELNTLHNDSSSSNDDSDDDADEGPIVNASEYNQLKENKDLKVHGKVNEILKDLENKKLTKSNDLNDKDSDNDEEEYLSADESLNDEEEEEEGVSDSDESYEDTAVKWKDNLAKKAEDAFFERQNSSKNLMKIVYGVFNPNHKESKNQAEQQNQAQSEDSDEEIGGLFKVASKEQKQKKMEKDLMNLPESTLAMPWNSNIRNWLDEDNKTSLQNCFVTGKWKESEDAQELLKLDDLSDADSEVFGDFEDLETGEKHTASTSNANKGEKRKRDNNEEEKVEDKEALLEKKRKLKEKFDSEYDNPEKSGSSYYDELKCMAEKQAQLNKTVFENMPDAMRVQIEGFRAGMYVRMEFEKVPSEFIENFDPTYPIVVGALNMGEENVGYVNVKIKKHRWYKKILKANDPVIISLGWRRFQTLPLYTKLEDDMKNRYLKYTPEHLACNGHFWGPITPQGSGFLALQSCDDDPEGIKKQGFRIAATGVVQELDKSTQIMKKLKLIGYPMKIYKKTAFIKGMFNSALEVAKFEGARIKTVSGIRGQIKKAASKPEGVFRATFEDKIQLSDIVFCRTWYKVDVEHYYNPVTTLLLPPEKKNSWRGLRTTGEVKREKGIRNNAEMDSLYTEIEREAKVFKPLVIPRKLQAALPYCDKPKHTVRKADKKKQVERVAVIREPKEQKVSTMMKMIKTTFEHKQEQLKAQTKERMEKHRRLIEEQESRKTKKIQDKKKQVMRFKSKSQIQNEKKSLK